MAPESTLKTRLTQPFRDFIPPIPQNVPRKALIIEIIIVLSLSLGKSGVEALVRLTRFVTSEEGRDLNKLDQATVVMSGVNSATRPIYDLLSQVLDVAWDCAPVALAAWLLWNSRTPIQEVWIKAGHRAKAVVWQDVAKACLIAGTVGGIGIIFYLAANAAGFAVTVQVGDDHDTWRYWFHLVTDAFATSLLEECIVLGYFLVRLRQLGVGAGKALTFAAVLRGSYHLYQGLWGFVGNFFMGLVFGYLYMKWGRVTPLIIAHFIMDTVAFVGLALLAGHVSWIPV